MIDDGNPAHGWALVVNKVVRGDRFARPQVIVGPTPDVLKRHGLNAGALTMMVAKLARCRREHSEVSLATLQSLPRLLENPLAIFPSARDDGSIVSMLMALDSDGNPVIVALTQSHGDLNAILSVYGKEDGFRWAVRQMDRARANGLLFMKVRASPPLCRSRQQWILPPRRTV